MKTRDVFFGSLSDSPIFILVRKMRDCLKVLLREKHFAHATEIPPSGLVSFPLEVPSAVERISLCIDTGGRRATIAFAGPFYGRAYPGPIFQLSRLEE